MSSILTNSSAMVALDTLRGINKGMSEVQSEISTGKKVSNAKDNAAVYAISTVMSSDVASFDKISESLNLGSATVGVARAASEQVVDLLTEMKTLIVSAQEDNVDRSKIETDVAALKNSIDNIVGAAQFNGQNLIKGAGSIDVLASLDRASDGSVSATNINVSKVSLETAAETAGTTGITTGNTGFGAVSNGGAIADGTSQTATFTAGALSEGDTFTLAIEGEDITYVAKDGETLNDVASNLKTQVESNTNITAGWTVDITQVSDPSTTDTVLTLNNGTGADTTGVTANGFTGGTVGGGLSGLSTLSVADDASATSALSAIDGLLATAIDAAASFGSAQKSIDVQDEFVTSLTDSMKVGIGALVDADLEAASARLQSLQVQQQLGTQSLSIANQAPQSLLSLFQ